MTVSRDSPGTPEALMLTFTGAALLTVLTCASQLVSRDWAGLRDLTHGWTEAQAGQGTNPARQPPQGTPTNPQ